MTHTLLRNSTVAFSHIWILKVSWTLTLYLFLFVGIGSEHVHCFWFNVPLIFNMLVSWQVCKSFQLLRLKRHIFYIGFTWSTLRLGATHCVFCFLPEKRKRNKIMRLKALLYKNLKCWWNKSKKLKWWFYL